MKFQLSIIASSILMLSACGGGSSNSTEPVNQSVATQTQTQNTQTEPNFSDDDFKVSFFSKNSCSETPTQSTVVFHQEDGVVLHEVDSPENGVLNTKWPTDAKHLSFIRISKDDNGQTVKDVITWYSASKHDLFEKVVFTDDETCGCNSKTFDFSPLKASNPNYYLSGINETRQPLNELDTQDICFQGQSKSLFIDDGEFSDVRAVSLQLGDSDTEVKDSDFAIAGTRITLSSNVDINYARLKHYQDNDLILSQYDKSNWFYFNDLPGQAVFEPYYSLTKDVDFPLSVIAKNTQPISQLANDVLVTKLEFTSMLQSKILEFASEATTTVTPSFEFAQVDEKMDAIVFYVSWKDPENGTVKWTVNAKPEGQLPDFWLGSKVKQSVTNAVANGSYLELHATGFEGSYDEYIKYLHKTELTKEKAITDGFYNNSTVVKVNNVLSYN